MIRFIVKFASVLCIGFALMPGTATAGWIAISNDTNQTVVVQESITVNGQVRRCKPIKLAPGEVLREFQPSGGTKKLAILESGLFGKQLFTGDLTWKEDTAFSIHKETDKVKVTDTATLAAKAKTPSKPTTENKPK